MTFYVTFGQKSPFKNGWVKVEAIDEADAHKKVLYAIGNVYSMLYSSDDFKSELFPLGQIGETIK